MFLPSVHRQKHTSPHQTTQQQWLHGYSGAPPMHSVLGKIRAKTRVTRQATSFFFACCGSHHMGLRASAGPFMSAFHFISFSFVFLSWVLSKTKRALYCYRVSLNLVISRASAPGFFPVNVRMRKVFPGNKISVWATSQSCRWLLCIDCEGCNSPPTMH